MISLMGIRVWNVKKLGNELLKEIHSPTANLSSKKLAVWLPNVQSDHINSEQFGRSHRRSKL